MRSFCLSLFFLSLLCLAGDFFEEKEIENGFSKRDGDPQTIRISVLEVSQANRLYDEVSRDRKIPYRYSVDGCYARATAMTLIAEKQGIQMGKVFARGRCKLKRLAEDILSSSGRSIWLLSSSLNSAMEKSD